MSFITDVGKAAFGTVKLGAGAATGIGKATGGLGRRIMDNAMSNPLRAATHLGGAAAMGFALADMDGRSDGAAVAGKAAVTSAALSAIPGMSTVGAVGAAGVAGGLAGVGGAAMAVGRGALKMPTEAVSLSNMKDIKFSGLGKGLLVGGAAIEGTSRAVKKYEQIRMGKNDGMLRRATPVIPQNESQPSYANNGGATGDLVFSMYNNR